MSAETALAPKVPEVAAVCGLYCPACSVFIASHEDPERLAAIAARWGVPVDEMHCDGCRSETRMPYCRECTFFSCAAERGYDFCVECEDYPCRELDDFQRERPHRAEIYENLERISTIGVEGWLAEVRARYACASCETINSAYDLKCRSCGGEPASPFVSAHRREIQEALARQGL